MSDQNIKIKTSEEWNFPLTQGLKEAINNFVKIWNEKEPKFAIGMYSDIIRSEARYLATEEQTNAIWDYYYYGEVK